jgi:hypothetical protein
MTPDRLLLLLELTTSLAHGEAGPNASGPNNTTLFHRQLTLLPAPVLEEPSRDSLDAVRTILAQYPLGDSTQAFLQALTGGQVLACLFVAHFPLAYGGSEGTGLFSGMARYQYLSTRLGDGAAVCGTLAELFSFLARKLDLPHPPDRVAKLLVPFFTLPLTLQTSMLQSLRQTLDLVIMGARYLVESMKLTDDEYAAKAGQQVLGYFYYTLTEAQQAQLRQPHCDRQAVRLPAVSGNALRHILLREPGATRLLQALGLDPKTDPVPVGVERFLFGGGNTAAKVTAPSNADILEATMRQRYPFIDALGGAVDRFLLSRSAVSVASWLVCRENNAATEAVGGVRSDISLLDTIAELTRTRTGIGGHDKESGQMIFSYEVLPPGTQLLVEIRFQPFTALVTKGATQQMVQDWMAGGASLGAKNAQGHGRCIVRQAELPYADAAEEYCIYLAAEHELLADGLRRGTFGTEMVLCAAT